MRHIRILKLRYLLLIFLLLFEVSIASAREILTIGKFIRPILRPIYRLCENSLNINPIIENEQQLRDQGYTDTYIAGFDHVRENLQLAERLRADEIDSFTYHIKEFADLIDTYIEHIEEGIRSRDSDDREMRLNLLESLKVEVREHQISRRITYRYWLNLISRFAVLVTPMNERPPYLRNISDLIASRTMEDTIKFFQDLEKIVAEHYRQEVRSTWHQTQYLIDEFPERIIIPTKHKLGRASINETHGRGVQFVGLNNKTTRADGTNMSPYNFLRHDENHAYRIEDVDDPQLASYVRQEMNRFPKPQREILWDIFYEITYEQGYTLNMLQGQGTIITRRPPGLSWEDIRRGQDTLIRIIRRNPYVRL